MGGSRSGVVVVVGDEYCDCESSTRELTVKKTSLFHPGDGFAVYEQGQGRDRDQDQDQEQGAELVFRVETYDGNRHHHLKLGVGVAVDDVVLMGPHGECILTIRKKMPSLHQRWEGFIGELADQENEPSVDSKKSRGPLFSIRRSSIISRFGASSDADTFLVEVYLDNIPTANLSAEVVEVQGDSEGHANGTSVLNYHVEGSFAQRCFTVYQGESVVVESVRKVDASTNVMLGRDVFCLRLTRGFDAAFAMGLVLALDQITGDKEAEDATNEDKNSPIASTAA